MANIPLPWPTLLIEVRSTVCIMYSVIVSDGLLRRKSIFLPVTNRVGHGRGRQTLYIEEVVLSLNCVDGGKIRQKKLLGASRR